MPKLELSVDLKTDRPLRSYSRGDVIGSISLVYDLGLKSHRWHWWGWETEWTTIHTSGFATFEECLRDFSKNSHPEPIEFDGVEVS